MCNEDYVDKANPTYKRLGTNARRLAKTLKKKPGQKGFIKVMVRARDFDKKGAPTSVASRLVVMCYRDCVCTGDLPGLVYVFDIANKDACLHSILTGLEYEERMQSVKRRRIVTERLDELADWCLNEGQFSPKLYDAD